MLFSQDKNFVTWNTQILDSYRDIIISFDYARYSKEYEPQGGFCIVFIETEDEVPKIGGPGYCLGYTPSPQQDYCYQKGYKGLNDAYLGIGFDPIGNFALKTGLVSGLLKAVPNSCTVRDSEANNYEYIATSKDFFYTPKQMFVSKKITDDSEIEYNTIRVIVSKAFTELEVQIKKENEVEYYSVLKTKLNLKKRTGLKVGVTNTFIDNYTVFDLKNFNVAGFPGKVSDPFVEACVQTEQLATYVQGVNTVSSVNFCALPAGGVVNVYELKNGKFELNQVIQETENTYLLGGNEKFLLLGFEKSYNVEVYYKLSNVFYKVQTINLEDEVDPEFSSILSYPLCADTDNRNLVIGDGESVHVFDYITGISTFGFFSYKETLTNHISGSIGRSVQVDNKRILTGGGKRKRFDSERYESFVAFYEDNGFGFTDNNTQNFVSPTSGNLFNEFGKILCLQGNELIVGAPNEFRKNKKTLGQGEVYHYVYGRKQGGGGREWRSAMELANFFKLDTVGGNFGEYISFLGNNLVVSSPNENYHYPPDLVFENLPNVGRVYIFRKNKGGTFSQAAVVTPNNSEDNKIDRIEKNTYYGRLVGLYSNLAAAIMVPYKDVLSKAELDFIKIGCLFDTPPLHLEIREDSYGLYDTGGYIIDIETDTYMQKYIVK